MNAKDVGLRDAVAIVVGGGSGFGRAIAQAFAAQGAAVCVTSRNEHHLREAVAAITALGGSACSVVADFMSAREAEMVVSTTRNNFGPPTILVFSAAAPGPFGPIWTVEPESWWAAMTLHLRGPLLLLKYALPEMIGRRAGRILLITSPAGNGTHTSLSAYCLGKGAQTHLAAQVDCEAREFGVRAFAVDPGLAFTKMANDTVSDLAALHFLPEMVQRLRFLSGNASNASALQRCGERCVRLVSGKYDQLAGRFLPNEIDLDELLERMQRADREIHDPDGGQQR